MSDMVRLRGLRGQDECNCRGVSYKVNRWGCVEVPIEDVGPLLKVGGFSIADEATEGVATASLEDVYDAAWHLPLGKVRDTMLNLLSNANARNLLVERARPSVTII
jgi:hypothetical protein